MENQGRLEGDELNQMEKESAPASTETQRHQQKRTGVNRNAPASKETHRHQEKGTGK